MSSKAETENEEVLRLKKEIMECQKEMQMLLYEISSCSQECKIMEQLREVYVTSLREKIERNVRDHCESEKAIKSLKASLDNELENKSKLEKTLKEKQKYLKHKRESQLRLDELYKSLSDDESDDDVSDDSEVEEMEKKLLNLNTFCSAMYSTLQLGESIGELHTTCSTVKDAKRDHVGGQNLRKRKGRAKNLQ
ncbi:hypothetical protein ABKV19_025870 [Rosa sericea]